MFFIVFFLKRELASLKTFTFFLVFQIHSQPQHTDEALLVTPDGYALSGSANTQNNEFLHYLNACNVIKLFMYFPAIAVSNKWFRASFEAYDWYLISCIMLNI